MINSPPLSRQRPAMASTLRQQMNIAAQRAKHDQSCSATLVRRCLNLTEYERKCRSFHYTASMHMKAAGCTTCLWDEARQFQVVDACSTVVSTQTAEHNHNARCCVCHKLLNGVRRPQCTEGAGRFEIKCPDGSRGCCVSDRHQLICFRITTQLHNKCAKQRTSATLRND